MKISTHTEFDEAVYEERKAALALVDDLKRQKTGLLTAEPDLEILDAVSDFETIDDCLNDISDILNAPKPGKPGAFILKASTGLGKTYGTIRWASDLIHSGAIKGPILHVVADMNNMHEADDFYRKFGITPTLLKGMVNSGCIKGQEVEDRYLAGLSARTLCKMTDEDGVEHFCPLYNACKYVQTRREISDNPKVDVVICSAEYLRSGGIPKELEPALIIVDENFSDKLIYESFIKMDSLGLGWTVSQKSSAGNRLAKLSKQIVVLAMDRKPIVEGLLEKYEQIGELQRELKAIINHRNREKMSIAKGKAKKNSVVKQEVMRNEMMIWESLLEEVSHRIEHGADSKKLGAFHIVRDEKAERLDISKRNPFPYPNTPVIGLDATADEDIYKGVLQDTHDVRVDRIKSKPNNLFITAIIGQSFSSSSLTYDEEGSYVSVSDGRTRNPKEETELRQGKLSANLARILEIEGNRKILICCTSANVDVILQDLDVSAELRRRIKAKTITVRHFGTLKGVNEFQNYDTTIVVGKLEAHDNTVTRLARGFCTPMEAVELTGSKTRRISTSRTLYTYSNQSAEMRTSIYEDENMRKIQEQIREQEIIQCLGRTRSVNRPNEDLRAYLITDAVPEGLILDNVFHVDDIAKQEPSALQNLAEESGYIVSAAGYQLLKNVTFQSAGAFLKTAGFIKDLCPQGWTLVKAPVQGRRGAPMKVYIPSNVLKEWEKDGSLEGRVRDHMLTCGKLDDEADEITLRY